jgi:hypothetical protein
MKSERVEQWLQDIRSLSEERYQLLQSLRQTILALDNTVTEEMKYGGILFGTHGHFCGIFSYKQHVGLEFGEGARMPDPYQVLDGKGKGRRHIKLTSVQEIKTKHVLEYLVAVLKLVKQ